MSVISGSATIELADGYSTYEVDSAGDLELTFSCGRSSQVFIRILNCGSLTLSTVSEENADLTVLLWNGTKETLSFHEKHIVKRNASLKIAYAEIEQADSFRDSEILLLEEGASAQVSSAVLTGVRKQFNLKVSSQAPHTTGTMQNYSVVLKGGNYQMHATGEIVKGAVRSESHQTSRALCFDEGMSSEILPILLIDENDVQASHATSVGRVDEDQLYYMQSRGLTPKQCTGLISTGYLLPVTAVIDDEELRGMLREELERKIEELCSM